MKKVFNLTFEMTGRDFEPNPKSGIEIILRHLISRGIRGKGGSLYGFKGEVIGKWWIEEKLEPPASTEG